MNHLSHFAASTVANGIGILFPRILNRLGFDPIYGGVPGSTLVQDVCTILVHFGVAMAFRL